MKKNSIGLIIILLIFTVSCSPNGLSYLQNNKISYDKLEISDIDKTLSNMKYSYSNNVDKKYISVIQYQSKTIERNEYEVDKDAVLNLNMPRGSIFIVSLPANRTIAYTWNIKNNIENEKIKFEDRSWISIPTPEKEKYTVGVSYDRQNFYFKSIKAGNQKIVMRYEHQTEPRDEFFEITLNVKIK